MRNTNNQLKIHAFDDYFGYRALIDEVNVWVLPDIGEEPGGGLTLKGTTESEKAIESRLEEGCYYLLFDARTHRGANQAVRDWVSRVLSPDTSHLPRRRTVPATVVSRLRFAAPLAPCQNHGHGEKPAGLET